MQLIAGEAAVLLGYAGEFAVSLGELARLGACAAALDAPARPPSETGPKLK